MMWGSVNPYVIHYAFAPGLPNGHHSAKRGRTYAFAFIPQVGQKWSKRLYLGYVGYICVDMVNMQRALIGTAVLYVGSTCGNMVNMKPR